MTARLRVRRGPHPVRHASAARSPAYAPTTWPRPRSPRLLVDAPDLDPRAIDEVVLGNANGAGEDNRNVARMAALLAGLPGLGARLDGQPTVRLSPRRRDGRVAD